MASNPEPPLSSLHTPPPFVPIHRSPAPSLSMEYTTSWESDPEEGEARQREKVPVAGSYSRRPPPQVPTYTTPSSPEHSE